MTTVMDSLNFAMWLVLTASVLTVLVFSLYPVILLLLSFLSKSAKTHRDKTLSPTVTIFIIVRNAEELLQQKIQNSLAVNYPEKKLQVVIVSDGSDDKTESIVAKMTNDRVVLFTQSDHRGKSTAINNFFHECSGEIIIFSDVDAIINSDAVLKLVDHFQSSGVGGVCGQRVIQSDVTKITQPQKGYIKFDSLIKKLENSSGSITSNDGKLFAIRKELFCPIKESVTDDMFIMLSVVKQGYRFNFEPDAIAHIRTPSRSHEHEIERRRRITTGSIRAIVFNKALLNPRQYGFYSFKLFINKILRRLMPVCLVGTFFSSLWLSHSQTVMLFFFVTQAALYLFAALFPILFQSISKGNKLTKMSSVLWYFCLGNYGQLLGLIDSIRNKTVAKWDPKKDDSHIGK